MLLRHYVVWLYADYVSGDHRRHIQGLLIVLSAGLRAAIFTKYLCCELYIIVRRLLAYHVGQLAISLPLFFCRLRME